MSSYYNDTTVMLLQKSGKFEVIIPEHKTGLKALQEKYSVKITPIRVPNRTKSNQEVLAGIIEVFGKKNLED